MQTQTTDGDMVGKVSVGDPEIRIDIFIFMWNRYQWESCCDGSYRAS